MQEFFILGYNFEEGDIKLLRGEVGNKIKKFASSSYKRLYWVRKLARKKIQKKQGV